jgi:PhnB protein
MQTRLNPYIGFKGQAREAIGFYQTVFGGAVQINTYKEFGASQDPKQDDLVMHSILEADKGIVLMASDVPDHFDYTKGTDISVSLSGDDETELRGYFDKLSQGGTVTGPLAKASWGDTFGMLVDRFGIAWLVNITAGTD